jgi:hypothetical protein
MLPGLCLVCKKEIIISRFSKPPGTIIHSKSGPPHSAGAQSGGQQLKRVGQSPHWDDHV